MAENKELKLQFKFQETGSGYGHLLYEGKEIATVYNPDSEGYAEAIADIIIKVNGKGVAAQITNWIRETSRYYNAKSVASKLTNPFEIKDEETDNGNRQKSA